MNVEIEETNILKKQTFEIFDEVSIIYGYNNSGKTTILKAINKAQYEIIKENYFNKQLSDISLYIPTNRVIISNAKTQYIGINDLEDLINYEKNMLKDYELHLKKIRDYLMECEVVNKYIYETVNKLFNVKLPLDSSGMINDDARYSDGIENIINIYLNIIWILTWDVDIFKLNFEKFKQKLNSNKAFIMIDEIEMFLHVNIQSKFINLLKKEFAKCSFIFTTHSPLLLTRYRNASVYNIKDGMLYLIDEKLFYEDLNTIFEEYFSVEEIPSTIRDEINYLGDLIMKEADIDNDRIQHIDKLIKEDYPNVYRKYNKLIVKAKYIGEQNV